MRRSLLFVALVVLAGACRSTPQFDYCAPSTFANCTIAKCTPKSDGSGFSCACFVDSRYSATSHASTCIAATDTTAQSRFHPVESYQVCSKPQSQNPIWAWCLGVTCTIDANGTSASCDCTLPPAGVQRFPYIVVTSTPLPDACQAAAPGEVWSSATPGNVTQITDFLRRQRGLHDIRPPVVLPTP